jgi:hypothetical protein
MRNDKQYIVDVELDVILAARGMKVSYEKMLYILSDGRAISRFTEEYVCEVYGISPQNINHKGSDAVGALDTYYSIKTLTKGGVAVCLSSNIGKGRTCTEQDVKTFIKGSAVHVFVDNTKLPVLSLMAVNSAELMDWPWNNAGKITYNLFYQQENIRNRERKPFVLGSRKAIEDEATPETTTLANMRRT